MMMKERSIEVGAPVPLAGILTEPHAAAGAPTTAVVLLNAGVLHRVGANRLNFVLAQRMAALGLLAVRFDAAGIGESSSRGPRASTLRPEIADIIEVMDHIHRTRGIHRFVLAGLCSGAEQSLDAAAADERVVGVIALEGYAYPTVQFWLRRYAPRLLVASTWRRLLAGQNPMLRSMRQGSPTAEIDGPFSLRAALGGRRPTPKSEIEGILKMLVARKVAMLAVYAGGSHHYYNYTGQLRDTFPTVRFGDLLDVVHEANADHTFSGVRIRRRVVQRIEEWVSTRGFGRATPAVSAD